MYQSRLQSPLMDNLFEAILSLENQEECYRFFEDLATIQELKTLAQRWQVAKMLTADETYANIYKETGVSATTVSRVKKCLDYGADGYRMMLERMEKK